MDSAKTVTQISPQDACWNLKQLSKSSAILDGICDERWWRVVGG